MLCIVSSRREGFDVPQVDERSPTWLTCSAILLTGLISGPSFSVSDNVCDSDLAALASALFPKANHSQNGTAGSIASAAPVNLLETQIRRPLLGPPNQNLWT